MRKVSTEWVLDTAETTQLAQKQSSSGPGRNPTADLPRSLHEQANRGRRNKQTGQRTDRQESRDRYINSGHEGPNHSGVRARQGSFPGGDCPQRSGVLVRQRTERRSNQHLAERSRGRNELSARQEQVDNLGRPLSEMSG